MMDINTQLRELSMHDRTIIREYIDGSIDIFPLNNIFLIAVQSLVYVLENSKYPDELEPSKWHLPD